MLTGSGTAATIRKPVSSNEESAPPLFVRRNLSLLVVATKAALVTVVKAPVWVGVGLVLETGTAAE